MDKDRQIFNYLPPPDDLYVKKVVEEMDFCSSGSAKFDSAEHRLLSVQIARYVVASTWFAINKHEETWHERLLRKASEKHGFNAKPKKPKQDLLKEALQKVHINWSDRFTGMEGYTEEIIKVLAKELSVSDVRIAEFLCDTACWGNRGIRFREAESKLRSDAKNFNDKSNAGKHSWKEKDKELLIKMVDEFLADDASYVRGKKTLFVLEAGEKSGYGPSAIHKMIKIRGERILQDR